MKFILTKPLFFCVLVVALPVNSSIAQSLDISDLAIAKYCNVYARGSDKIACFEARNSQIAKYCNVYVRGDAKIPCFNLKTRRNH